MNDTELDDMLNQWEAPEVPARLRDSIKLPSPERKWRFSWPSWHLSKGLLAGALAGVAMCFIGVTAAFPQVFAPSARFNLRSESIEYRDDGSSRIQEYRESTSQGGHEIILDQTFPDSWLMTIHQRFFLTVHRLLGLEHPGPASMASDCSFPGNSVIGHETLLGFQTTELRFTGFNDIRYTEWRAPQLDCILMKTTIESLTNGEFKLTGERRPLAVRIDRTQ